MRVCAGCGGSLAVSVKRCPCGKRFYDKSDKQKLLGFSFFAILLFAFIALSAFQPVPAERYPDNTDGLADVIQRRFRSLESEERIRVVYHSPIKQKGIYWAPLFEQEVHYIPNRELDILVKAIFEFDNNRIYRSKSLSPFETDMRPIDPQWDGSK